MTKQDLVALAINKLAALPWVNEYSDEVIEAVKKQAVELMHNELAIAKGERENTEAITNEELEQLAELCPKGFLLTMESGTGSDSSDVLHNVTFFLPLAGEMHIALIGFMLGKNITGGFMDHLKGSDFGRTTLVTAAGLFISDEEGEIFDNVRMFDDFEPDEAMLRLAKLIQTAETVMANNSLLNSSSSPTMC